MTERERVLALRGITKRFGSLVANDAISLNLHRGEVLALLGENGAGKSTLVSILFGHYRADDGDIEVFGQALAPGNPAAALAAGIGMVHQHFTLADNLDVLDNILVGTQPGWQVRLHRREARARILELADRFGLALDPERKVGSLSVGEKQRVEILKALYRGARILILDEPTAVLTPQEVDSLFGTLRAFIDAGLAVIFISHKLDEVMTIADRVAVLRGGKLVAHFDRTATDKTALATAMVGHTLPPAPVRAAVHRGACVLSMDQVHARAADGHAQLLGASLQVHGGEIVAIAGVAGNGQAALADVVFGLAPVRAGALTLDGRPYPVGARAVTAAGVARVPEDRRTQGAIGDFALWENAAIEQLRDARFVRWPRVLGGLLLRIAMRDYTRSLIDGFDVRGPASPDRLVETPARLLSGGNLQKLILGRALTLARPPGPRLIVVDQPTWGLDIGAVADIHRRLIEARDAGDAVLVISEDLDEIFALADRVAVINHGRIVQTRAASDWTLSELGLAMAQQEAA